MYSNILLPIAFDPGHGPSRAFEAARLLAAKDATIRVMHVLEDLPAYATTHVPPELLIQSREAIEVKLKEQADQLPNATSVLTHGPAGRTIVDFANNNGVDCIVMTSHTPGLQDYLIGSTADRVVRHAKCSVHVIR